MLWQALFSPSSSTHKSSNIVTMGGRASLTLHIDSFGHKRRKKKAPICLWQESNKDVPAKNHCLVLFRIVLYVGTVLIVLKVCIFAFLLF